MRRLVIVLLTLMGLVRTSSAEEIADILIEGNTKTTTDTVQLIAQIDVGDDWKTEMKDQVEKRLVSSGLFSQVDVFWEPVTSGGVKVHITVKDKHSWVIAPAFYNQPTNTGGGVGYGENNLFGLNQKLLVYGQIATGDSFFVGAWVIPSLWGSRFYSQIDTILRSSRNIEYAAPTSYLEDPIAVRQSRMLYLNAGFKLGVEPIRGFKFDVRLRAAHVGYSDVKLCSTDTSDPTIPTESSCVHGSRSATLADLGPQGLVAPGKEGWDVSNEYQFTIDRRANWYGVYTGQRYQLSYEFGVPSLGSDFHYHRFGLALYKAWQVLERHNLVLRSNLNVGHRMPFQQEMSTGGTSMRGWVNNQFRGDFQEVANVEYSFPIFTLPFPEPLGDLSVRGLFFWDSAYTTFLAKSPDRNYLPSSGFDSDRFGAPFKNSVGVGTRFYLRSIVIPLLGLDFGYGLEARDFQVYLAIGLTD